MNDDDLSSGGLTDAELEDIRSRLEFATPGPWTSIVEGRDHLGGDSFIMIGTPDRRGEDLYLNRGSQPASAADQDLSRLVVRTYLDSYVKFSCSSPYSRCHTDLIA
jgi:hypothetical protein